MCVCVEIGCAWAAFSGCEMRVKSVQKVPGVRDCAVLIQYKVCVDGVGCSLMSWDVCFIIRLYRVAVL